MTHVLISVVCLVVGAFLGVVYIIFTEPVVSKEDADHYQQVKELSRKIELETLRQDYNRLLKIGK